MSVSTTDDAQALLELERIPLGLPPGLAVSWLGGIILNLLLVGGYGAIALRDFGLLLGALSLSRLATAYQRS